MTIPARVPMARPAATTGMRNSDRSISASTRVVAPRTKSHSSRAAPTKLASTNGEPMPASATSVTASRSRLTPPVRVSTPAQSSRCVRRSTRSCSTRAMIVTASRPTGTLMKKAQRHPTVDVSTPPRNGPAIAEMPHTLLKKPCIRARCRGSKMSPTMVKAIGCTAPPQGPGCARKMISWSIDCDRPHSTDPPTKMARPMRKIGLRPCWSARLDQMGTVVVAVSR